MAEPFGNDSISSLGVSGGSPPMIDVSQPVKQVEVLIRDNVLWLNVDGVCRARVSEIPAGIIKIDYDGVVMSHVGTIPAEG